MQNLANITRTEVVVVAGAMFVLCVAPTLLAWGDVRRRRKALVKAARLEAAARAAAVPAPAMTEAASLTSLTDLQQLWDEPTVTVDVDVLAAPPALAADAAVFGMPAELPEPAPSEAPPPVAPAPPVPESAAAPAAAEPVPAQQAASGESPHFGFCLQELRRVRLPNWPPPEVQEDAARNQVWRDAERLAAQHQREIGAAPLVSPHPVQSACLGSAEADAAGMRLRFLLFPVLWPSTAEQAIAEAVFDIDAGGATIGGHVNSLRSSK